MKRVAAVALLGVAVLALGTAALTIHGRCQHDMMATPSEQVAAAGRAERARVHDLAERILPVSARAAGLRADTRLGKRLGSDALEAVRTDVAMLLRAAGAGGSPLSARSCVRPPAPGQTAR